MYGWGYSSSYLSVLGEYLRSDTVSSLIDQTTVRLDKFSIDTLDRVNHCRSSFRIRTGRDFSRNQQLLGRLLPCLLRLSARWYRNIEICVRNCVPAVHRQDV